MGAAIFAQAAKGTAKAGVTLASGILQGQIDRAAASIEQKQLVSQAADKSIQRQEIFQRQQGVGDVAIGNSPGSSEQIQRAVQEAAGATAVDQQIIDDELKAQMDAIKNRFNNATWLLALDTFNSSL